MSILGYLSPILGPEEASIRRELILFDNAGVGRSSGSVPNTIAEMARDAAAFLAGLGVGTCALGFSLGGMVAQQMVLDRPTVFRRLILVGTAPRGGEDIMHLGKPSLEKHLQVPSNEGYAVLQRIFFTPTAGGQAAGAAFVARLGERKQDLDGVDDWLTRDQLAEVFKAIGSSVPDLR